MTEWQGKILTVMGPIKPEEAGVTLAHEHLVCNAEALMMKGPAREFPEFSKRPISTDIAWWVNHNPYSSFDNMHLEAEKDAVRQELMFFVQNGGGTIVENTTYGIQPSHALTQTLANFSMATGVKIVASTGYYVESSRGHTSTASIEEFADYMNQDITSGCEGTGIKAGVIGELGCEWPLAESEKRVLQAAAHIEANTGIPVTIHPGRNPQAPFELLRIYQEAGGHADRVLMSHMDRTIADPELLTEFAKTGCYLDYDLFGLETSYYQLRPEIDMPSDAERIRRIKLLVDEGFGDHITVGHDIHTKHRLMKYGGHGYSHILLHAVPKMLERGISQESVDKILKSNPQKWLTFTKHN